MTELNLDFVNAVPVHPPSLSHLHLCLVGCGGTGGWLAPSLVRLVYLLRESSQSLRLTFVDPDIVEDVNIPRQNFTIADLGLHKAKVLALRYGLAWGVPVESICDKFQPHFVGSIDTRNTTILIGCVDNAPARQAIHDAVTQSNSLQRTTPSLWWLDCGNATSSGQVVLGSDGALEKDSDAFAYPNLKGEVGLKPIFCKRLPAPSIQHPELLQPRPDELADSGLSCEQIAMLNAQALLVNQRVAVEAAEFLNQLLILKKLKRFASYFDLQSGVAKSRYINPTNLGAYYGTQCSDATADC